MNWKSLIFEKKEDTKPTKENEYTTRFPSDNAPPQKTGQWSTAVSFPDQARQISCEPYMEQVMAMYENGFNSLNMDGYDFFEFYKAIMDVGYDNPQAYKICMSMAKSMGVNINKELLISQADTYIKKIEEVHQSYATSGKSKESELLNKERIERETLISELGRMREEIDVLERNIQLAEKELAGVKNKYLNEVQVIECKNMANDKAKDAIIQSIKNVVNGIKSNI